MMVKVKDVRHKLAVKLSEKDLAAQVLNGDKKLVRKTWTLQALFCTYNSFIFKRRTYAYRYYFSTS